jgi:hypothetical protein
MEHTDEIRRAQKIAMDHLVEDPHYYEKLAQMEAQPNTSLRPLSDRERQRLEKLDDDLSDIGFPNQVDDLLVRGDVEEPLDYLVRTKQDVWNFHYRHVGDEESRHLYVEAEKLIEAALRDLRGSRAAKPNRVRVFDAEDDARKMRETFTAKPVREKVKFRFRWPAEMQHVGDSLAVAYSSDKWKDDDDLELYKHLAESRNVVLCVPGFLRDGDSPTQVIETIGPTVSFADTPMPRDIAILALFEEANLQLHVDGTDDAPELGRKDDGVIKVSVAHGHLGGGKMHDGRVFLVVYTERDGVLMLILGDELDVLADGIVG